MGESLFQLKLCGVIVRIAETRSHPRYAGVLRIRPQQLRLGCGRACQRTGLKSRRRTDWTPSAAAPSPSERYCGFNWFTFSLIAEVKSVGAAERSYAAAADIGSGEHHTRSDAALDIEVPVVKLRHTIAGIDERDALAD